MTNQRVIIAAYFLAVILVSSAEEKWTGKWFPNNPEEEKDLDGKKFSANLSEVNNNPSTTTTTTNTPTLETSTQKNVEKNEETKKEDSSDWSGKWFPNNPNDQAMSSSGYKESNFEKDRIMGIPNINCDNGETNLRTDFDPSNKSHVLMYTCLESTYKPDSNLEPIQTLYDVPKFYTPVHLCMNETITYDQHIPTLGYHRPLWPMYGEYTFVPPQRWLHSLEHGAIVMLYHPCAIKSEVDKLRSLIKKCLYRHIITPYNLTKERPLALVAWATSLELSAYDKTTAVEFIKNYAKTGPEKVSRQGQYKQMLIDEAKVVSDADDSVICPDLSAVM